MLLVSIHDVSPARAHQVARLWEMCAARGVCPALLVVPNWHGEWPLARHRTFVRWLHDRVADGAEIVLHGYRHDEVGAPRRVIDHWRALGRTAREGEFLTLREAAARARIADGLAVLRALELEPIGFIPPAWLAREDCHAAAAALGLGMSEDTATVWLHHRAARVSAPVVCWSARTAPRAWGSVALAELRWLAHRRAVLVRFALHPTDLDHPATARSVVAALDRWVRARRLVSYRALCGDAVAAVASAQTSR
jgi:predicted deacetylase